VTLNDPERPNGR